MQDARSSTFWIMAVLRVNLLWSHSTPLRSKWDLFQKIQQCIKLLGTTFPMYWYIGWLPPTLWDPGEKINHTVENLSSQSNLHSIYWEQLRSQLPAFIDRTFDQERSLPSRSHFGLSKIGVWHIWTCLIHSPSWSGGRVSWIHLQLTWESNLS